MKPNSVMRTLLCLALGLAPVGLSAFTANDQLHAVGASVENQSGCPVYLHGVDVSGFEYDVAPNDGAAPGCGAFPASDVLTTVEVAAEQWNCNFVRIPLNQDFWLGTGTGSPCTASGSASGDEGAAYQSMVTTVVQWCNAHNVYVLLDLHWSGVGTTACSSSQHDMPDVNALTFWQSVASAFPASSYPGVCFDLYNEPGGGQDGGTDLTANDAGWSFWLNGGTETAAASSSGSLPDGVAYYTPGMQALLTAIRNTGATNLVFAGGINWAFDLAGLAGSAVPFNETDQTYWLTDTTGAGVVYATHIYPWKQSGCSCNNAGCFYGAVAGVTASAKPFMVTEFGPDQPQGYSCGTSYSSTSAVDPEDFVPPMVSWLHTNSVPFSAWNLGSSGPQLIYLSSPGTGYSGWSYDAANPGQSSYPPTTYFGSYVLADLTASADSSACITPTETFTVVPSASPTFSVSPTITPTPSISTTPSISPTPSISGTFTPTPSVTETPTASPPFTATATQTTTPSFSATWTPSPAATGAQAPEIYPNPFHPGQGPLRFADLERGSEIHIYDIIGRRVCFITAVGNPAVDAWDGLNDNGRQVTVGIYIVYIKQPTGRHDLVRVAVLP